MRAALNKQFEEVLEPLGPKAAEFFLAASLYQAHKVSFAAAAALAGLSFVAFNERLREHFGEAFKLDDEVIKNDLKTIRQLRPKKKSKRK